MPLIFRGFKPFFQQLAHRSPMPLYCPSNTPLVKLQVKNQVKLFQSPYATSNHHGHWRRGVARYFLAFASRADCNALVSLCPSAPVSAAIIVPVSPSTSTGQGIAWTPYCTATAAFQYWPS